MKEAIAKSKYALLKNEEDLSESQKEKLTVVVEYFPQLAEKHDIKAIPPPRFLPA